MGEFDDGFCGAKNYKLITVYCSHGDGGDEYRRGGIIGVFRSQSLASTYARGRGWYGGDGGTSERKAIELDCGDVFLLDENASLLDLDGTRKKAEREAKKKALNKLTQAERELLGLSDIVEDE